MIINQQSLQSLFTGFGASFKKGFDGAESHYRDVAMVVPSATRQNNYGWLGQFPKIREWIGDRVVKNLSASSYVVVNRMFESTVSVPRTSIEDDQFGVFSPIVEEMGKAAAEFPDEMIFGLLKAGFQTLCFDGQYFFDIDHPVFDPAQNTMVMVSNMQAGAGPAWFLLDTSRAMKPMLYQERSSYTMTQLINDGDQNVFFRDEYIYGTRGRSNAGFGLWQLAFASKAALTAANYAAARAQMMNLRGDEGRILGITPTLLVVPPALEEAGRTLLGSALLSGGGTNPWAGSAELLTTPWVS
ncbi:Mu-like prophage major head subunit gpT family protein [Methylobacterium sp. sgz302541]|uniref:Mu-like prophage major head subunit gpT family protein n=1 Tax=unclassified Methylobacterium TaxID=2615210 RepID=UPI003D3422A2